MHRAWSRNDGVAQVLLAERPMLCGNAAPSFAAARASSCRGPVTARTGLSKKGMIGFRELSRLTWDVKGILIVGSLWACEETS